MPDSTHTPPQKKNAHTYHLSLALTNKRCVIVGFGPVGQRKLPGLLAGRENDGLLVQIFDPHPELKHRAAPFLSKYPTVPLIFLQERVDETILKNAHLVFACTSDKEENQRIARLCREWNILCNCAAPPEAGDVALPATIDLFPITLTLSTHGASPALSRKWHKELAVWAAKKRPMALFMAQLRPYVLALGNRQEENQSLLRSLAESPLEDWLAQGDYQAAQTFLTTRLPDSIREILPELFSAFRKELRKV